MILSQCSTAGKSFQEGLIPAPAVLDHGQCLLAPACGRCRLADRTKVDDGHKKCIQIFAEEACCRNKGYDFDSLFSNIFSRVSIEASRFFCSEFVYQTLAACGVTSPRNDNLAPRPADLPEWLDLTPVRIK